MTLSTLKQLGRIEKEFEINSQLTIKLHTLTVGDQQKVLADIPAGVEDISARFTYVQFATLLYATDSLNGKVYNETNRDELREFYTNLQYTLLFQIFSKYMELSDEQTKVLEDLKKK
jgi:ssDNA-specific exonuclease RecJ